MMIDYSDFMTDMKQAMSELDSPAQVYKVLRLVHADVLGAVDAEIAGGKTLRELVGSNGLTKSDERALRSALTRLEACNRRAYLGGQERYAIDMAVMGIRQRLEPTPVHQLLSAAEKICTPLEGLLRDIDGQNAVAECLE